MTQGVKRPYTDCLYTVSEIFIEIEGLIRPRMPGFDPVLGIQQAEVRCARDSGLSVRQSRYSSMAKSTSTRHYRTQLSWIRFVKFLVPC